MPQTALQLVQAACYEANIAAPSALVGATDASTLQLLNLFYACGRDLRQARWWPQLKRQYSISMVAGRSQYALPQDFFSTLPSTMWDQQNKWEMRGPLSDSQWNYRTYGFVTVENRKAYRVFGPDINPNDDHGQFWMNPVPGTGDNGKLITFEYLSKSWLVPPLWAPSASVSSVTPSWRFSNGNIYKCTTTGTTSATGAAFNPPNMANGTGQDGGVYWTYITASAWQATTAYAQGEYVTNGGNTYLATSSGISAGFGGPTGTSTTATVTDNTVTWQYVSIPAWTAETTYAAGVYVSNGGNKYVCSTPPNVTTTSQKSGKIGPNWTATTVTDGTAVWTYQAAPYEALVTDSDFCLFDESLMILGLKWRFMQARGFGFQDLQGEYELKKNRAVSRWNTGQVLHLASSPLRRSINVPEGSFG